MTTTTTPAQQLRDGNAVGTWSLDLDASTISTATGHFWGLITVHGSFSDASGTAAVAADGTMTARLDVQAASIDTKNNKRDDHLRSDEFFNAERHPTISFATTGITITGDSTTHVTGVLTAGGAQQDLAFDATITAHGDGRATVTAEVEVDHRALGMMWSPMGMAKPTTKLHLVLTFTHGKPSRSIR